MKPGNLSKLLTDLNEVQREAVLYEGGPLLLLAGAGSGKTRVVTRRIARMIATGVDAHSIVAVTFTNRAAREMRSRIEDLLDEDAMQGLIVSTFHALGARFLRQFADRFGRTERFSIYDEEDQQAVLRATLQACGAPHSAVIVKAIERAIDLAKNAGREAEEASLPPSDMPLDMRQVGRLYEEALQRADAFDFGDLILRPGLLLSSDESLCVQFQHRWPRICVDEFQDTNAAQYRWLKCLAPVGSDLLVVGDDDQSIYGWRGAEVGNIITFPDAYPGARVLRMEQNYRSVGHILTAANSVIAQNHQRLGKDLWSLLGEGMQVELQACRDGRHEAFWVAERIQSLCADEGYALGDVAILVRANHLTLDFEQALNCLGLRYVVVRGRSFFERACVQDAIAYLRLAHNHRDDIAFLRALKSRSRGVGAKSLERLSKAAMEAGVSLYEAAQSSVKGLQRKAQSGIGDFLKILESYPQEGPLHERAHKLFQAADLLDEQGLLESDEEERQNAENIKRLLTYIETFVEENPGATLDDFLERVKLIGEADVAETSGGAVSMMTIHAAKGLEFSVVFVVGMEDGLFPSARALKDGQIEEERRLCYVAMTRARQRLLLTWAQKRQTFGEQRKCEPSRFLFELPEEVILQSAELGRLAVLHQKSKTAETRVALEPKRRDDDWDAEWKVQNAVQNRDVESQLSDRPEENFEPLPWSDEALYADAQPVEMGFEAEVLQVQKKAPSGWQPGARVFHVQFGEGEVTSIAGGDSCTAHVAVRFFNGVEQTILRRYLSLIDG